MTINQLLECVLGKSCLIEGEFGDATPFTNDNSQKNIAEQLCERLGMNGYSSTGKEMLYNGMTGEPMGHVFIGPVYYQRLKHLVDEKIHARDTGTVSMLYRAPVEGRVKGGGHRFGSMECDSIISHGASRFLKERLFDQSDPYRVPICQECGYFSTNKKECVNCSTDNVTMVDLPFATKLLLQDLSAMCIKTQIYVE